MKDIKDYLHLYLGCQISIGGRYNVTLTANYTDASHISLDHCLANPAYKPILRPLSSMTGQEMEEFYVMPEPMLTWRVDMYYQLPPNRFHWLLSKHFDLFDLIEDELAIQITTP